MKFLNLLWLGYRNFFSHISIFFVYTLLSYFVWLLIIGVLDFEFKFDANKFSIDSLSINLASMIYYFELWMFLYLMYVLNTAYITFVSFEKRSLRIFSKIFYFIKFCFKSLPRLITTFFAKPTLFASLFLFPILLLAVCSFFMNFYDVSKPVAESILTLITFPAFGLCMVLFVHYYLRLSLVEYSVLINKCSFKEAYEISVIGVDGYKLDIFICMIINLALSAAIFTSESAMLIPPHELLKDLDTENLFDLGTNIVLFKAFFYFNIPFIPLWATYISNCQVFKKYSYRNDEESAVKAWENSY